MKLKHKWEKSEWASEWASKRINVRANKRMSRSDREREGKNAHEIIQQTATSNRSRSSSSQSVRERERARVYGIGYIVLNMSIEIVWKVQLHVKGDNRKAKESNVNSMLAHVHTHTKASHQALIFYNTKHTYNVKYTHTQKEPLLSQRERERTLNRVVQVTVAATASAAASTTATAKLNRI